MNLRGLVITAVLLGFLTVSASIEQDLPSFEAVESNSFRITVARTETQVMIAKVHLTIGDLKVVDNQLVGEYAIEVPLRRSKNEVGVMQLPLEESITYYMERGGTITGIGMRLDDEDEEPRQISCKIMPGESSSGRKGRLLLTIKTGMRVLEFHTDYVLRGDLESVGLLTLK